MNPPPELIAVYGSLLRAEGGLIAVGAMPHLAYVGPARLPGTLHDLGDYPGLRWDGLNSGEPGVPGELFNVLDPRALEILDDYEGCTPEGDSDGIHRSGTGFCRRRIALLEPRVEAWVYLYRGSIEACPRITGQCWTEYKAARRPAVPTPPQRT